MTTTLNNERALGPCLDITITKAASSHIKKMLEKNQGVGFRLSVKKTGCSGYAYQPSVIETENPDDLMVESDGLKIFIDTQWLETLQGLRIDFVEEEKSGLKQNRLVFTNPNEASRCGCGESFQIE